MKTKVLAARHTDMGYLLNGSPGRYSQEQAILAPQTEHAYAGLVLGQAVQGAGSVTSAARAGNTGNGTLGTLTADAGADEGNYAVTFVAPTRFRVEDPGGVEVGTGTVGAPFNGPVNFTITAGGTPFAAGDGFTIANSYAAGTKQYDRLDLDALDGRQTAMAILSIQREASDEPQRCAITARQAEVNGNLLIWPDGMTEDQRAAAEAQLAMVGIIVRY